MTSRECKECGSTFYPDNRHQVYCSLDCEGVERVRFGDADDGVDRCDECGTELDEDGHGILWCPRCDERDE